VDGNNQFPAGRALDDESRSARYLALDQAPVVFELPDFSDPSVEATAVGSSLDTADIARTPST
jgi:hypothetical protein